MRRRMMLLGAGASVPAKIPAAYEMTMRMVDNLLGNTGDRLGWIFSNIVGSLIQQKSRYGGNPFSSVNVEDVFNAVDLLASRNRVEVAPFIASDHQSIKFVEALQREVIVPKGDLCERLKHRLRRELVKLTWLSDANDLEYMAVIVELASKQIGMCVATLNYDNTVELLAASRNYPCDHGLDAWFQNGTFEPASTGISLLKLHGSINWAWDTGFPLSDNPIPTKKLLVATSEQLQNFKYDPAVIFGHRNKLTVDGPFLDLLFAFRRELAASDELIVVGYSFSDPHINEYLKQWLNADPNRIMRVVDPGIPDTANVIDRFWHAEPLFDEETRKYIGPGLENYGKAYQHRIVVISKGIEDAAQELLAT